MTNRKKLYRSRTDKVILGVAAGMGEYFEVDPIIVRLIFVLLTIWGGAGLLFYIVAAIVIPEEPKPGKSQKDDVEEGEVVDDPEQRIKDDTKEFTEKVKTAAQDIKTDFEKKPNRGAQVFGLIVLLIGLSLLGQMYFSWLSFEKLWPLIVIGIGLVLIFNPRSAK